MDTARPALVDAGATLGAVLLRLADRAGYQGRDAFAYAVGRLGPGVTTPLLHQPLPPDWVACEELAERYGLDAWRLWDLLLEDRPAG